MKPPAFKKYMHECASAPDLFGGDRRKNGKLDGVQFFPLADVKTLCESTCERHSWGNTLRKRFAERCLETLCRGTFDGHPGKCSVKTVKDLAPTWLRTPAGRRPWAVPVLLARLQQQGPWPAARRKGNARNGTWAPRHADTSRKHENPNNDCSQKKGGPSHGESHRLP